MFTTSKEILDYQKSPETWTPILYRVKSKFQENEKNVTFILEPDGDKCIPEMKPGQYNMLYAFGIGEIPISVSSLEWEHPYLCHTIQSVGAVSDACYNLKIGDVIGVRGPFGTYWPTKEAHNKDVLMMAGGVGLAPLRPVLEEIVNERYLYKRVNVLYGSRNPHSMLFHTDVISWQSDPTVNFQVTVDHCNKNWRGNVGVVTSLMNLASFNPKETVAYVCGPEVMMRFSIYALLDAGVSAENIFISMERSMKCAIGQCGHCQWGSLFVCKDGPVFNYADVGERLAIREL